MSSWKVTIVPGPQNQLCVLFYKPWGEEISLIKFIDNSTPIKKKEKKIDVVRSQRALPPQFKARLQHRHMLKERELAGTREYEDNYDNLDRISSDV